MPAGTGSRHPGWPAEVGPLKVRGGEVRLRPIRLRDGRAWSRVRLADREYLQRWEPTHQASWAERHHAANWPGIWASLRAEARKDRMIPMIIEVDGELAGQVTVGNIVRAALQSAWIGYWVAESRAGQGVGTAALALAVDHCLSTAGLHRLEATVRPENVASRRLLEKVGFRQEGVLQRYLNVEHSWRHHLLMATTAGEFTESAADRLIAAGLASR